LRLGSAAIWPWRARTTAMSNAVVRTTNVPHPLPRHARAVAYQQPFSVQTTSRCARRIIRWAGPLPCATCAGLSTGSCVDGVNLFVPHCVLLQRGRAAQARLPRRRCLENMPWWRYKPRFIPVISKPTTAVTQYGKRRAPVRCSIQCSAPFGMRGRPARGIETPAGAHPARAVAAAYGLLYHLTQPDAPKRV
jgi:hypothetical protein